MILRSSPLGTKVSRDDYYHITNIQQVGVLGCAARYYKANINVACILLSLLLYSSKHAKVVYSETKQNILVILLLTILIDDSPLD